MSSPTVICLIGTSRCGSTLLQHVLNAHEGVAALGEVQRLEQLKAEGRKCACGEPVNHCPVWANDDAIRDDQPLLRAKGRARRVACAGAILAALSTGRMSLAPASERVAASRLADILKRTASRLSSEVVIDSSKDIDHFMRLALSGVFSLIPVHLVRDPRGVVHSAMTRTDADPESVARHWNRVNRAAHWLKRLTPQYSWQTVLYEEFCEDPFGIARDLLRAAGQSAPLPRLASIDSHALGGSPDFEAPNLATISSDKRWHSAMNTELLETTWMRTSFLANRFGYQAT